MISNKGHKELATVFGYVTFDVVPGMGRRKHPLKQRKGKERRRFFFFRIVFGSPQLEKVLVFER